jgi:hypothetical protein
MSVAALLSAIRESRGPVTGIELARRLGLSPGTVAQMLVALRASGQLGAEVRAASSMLGVSSVPGEPGPDACASSGSCSMSCPGPDECALTIDLNVTGLEIRSVTSDR